MTPTFLHRSTARANAARIAICLLYAAMLTWLLLTPHPDRLLPGTGLIRSLEEQLSPIAHFLAFFVLTILALLPQWPVSRWTVIGTLLAYAGATELLQRLTATRTPQWTDALQDLLGILIGGGAWWLLRLAGAARRTLRGDLTTDEGRSGGT